MDKGERRRLIRDWIAFYQKQSTGRTKQNFDLPEHWAVAAVDSAVLDEPEVGWSLILDLLSRELSKPAAGILAAGPLEDLIEFHGSEFIDRIETEARRDPMFRHLLGGVWETSDPEIWARVGKARGRAW